MSTPPTNNTSNLTNEEESGSIGTNSRLQLDPWEIAHLQISKRNEQPVNLEDATDDEFDAWVKAHDIPVKENGIQGWSFDDRCRLVNYALAHGYTLTFVDGKCSPESSQTEEEEVSSTAPHSLEAREDASAAQEEEE